MKHHAGNMRKSSDKALEAYKLVGFKFPEGFVLTVDPREQRPLFTRFPPGLMIKSATLKDGDYSVAGFEDKICFERKGISDLFPFCSTEREKTVKKMKRFKSMEFVGLIIEAKESEVLQYQQFTQVHPEVVRGAITSFQVRYGVHVFYGDRDTNARRMLDIMIKYYSIKKEV
jgi:DNA excision repair protein ERCC-4